MLTLWNWQPALDASGMCSGGGLVQARKERKAEYQGLLLWRWIDGKLKLARQAGADSSARRTELLQTLKETLHGALAHHKVQRSAALEALLVKHMPVEWKEQEIQKRVPDSEDIVTECAFLHHGICAHPLVVHGVTWFVPL